MLESYFSRIFRGDNSTTIDMERRFHIDVDDFEKSLSFKYTGVIDRISRNSNGIIRITDYKTGKRVPDPGQDLQLQSYALHVFYEYPADKIELCYEDLRAATTATAEISKEQVHPVYDDLLSKIQFIEKLTYFEPRPSVLCGWCGFNNICPVAKSMTLYTLHNQYLSASAEHGDKCPRCGAPLEERFGRRGRFIGCTEFPDCRYTRNDW